MEFSLLTDKQSSTLKIGSGCLVAASSGTNWYSFLVLASHPWSTTVIQITTHPLSTDGAIVIWVFFRETSPRNTWLFFVINDFISDVNCSFKIVLVLQIFRRNPDRYGVTSTTGYPQEYTPSNTPSVTPAGTPTPSVSGEAIGQSEALLQQNNNKPAQQPFDLLETLSIGSLTPKKRRSPPGKQTMCLAISALHRNHAYKMRSKRKFKMSCFQGCQMLYTLERKTPDLLSKQGCGIGSCFRRGLTFEGVLL